MFVQMFVQIFSWFIFSARGFVCVQAGSPQPEAAREDAEEEGGVTKGRLRIFLTYNPPLGSARHPATKDKKLRGRGRSDMTHPVRFGNTGVLDLISCRLVFL